MQGWIKLHRKMLAWEWYHDSKMVHLFIHLVLEANHQDKKWKGEVIRRGQLVTGRKALSLQTGISQQSIRSCLNKLKSTNEITIQPTNRFSIITVCNYEAYNNDKSEPNQLINQPAPNKQPTVNQQLTTNKNDKNDKNEKKKEKPLPKQLFLKCVKLTKIEHEALLEKFGEKGTKDKIFNIDDYKQRTGKKYKSDYLTILHWARDEKPDRKETAAEKAAKFKKKGLL